MNASVRRYLVAFRTLLLFTVLLGFIYPLTMIAMAQLPGLDARAEGSLVKRDGKIVASTLIGQSFTDKNGQPVKGFLTGRPSAAGDGYDPMSSGASNLGPEDVVDRPDNPSLLTQVCQRSYQLGQLYGVDGGRPYCTDDGKGAVLGVYYSKGNTGTVTKVVALNQHQGQPFVSSYRGVDVEVARKGADYARAVVVPVRGDAPARPAIPADAVTASGSGLDPHISRAYANLQVARVAQERGISQERVRELIAANTTGRSAGLLGEPRVNVVAVNLALQ